MIINYAAREKRYAVIKENTVDKIEIIQPRNQSSVGNIYLGVVEKVLPGMNAAFIQIGEGKNGYLHRDKLAAFILADEDISVKQSRGISSFVHQGEKLLVQVEKDAMGTKGPRLTGVLEFQGDHLVYMPKGRYVAISKKIEDHQQRENLRQFGYQIKDKDEGVIFRTSSVEHSKTALQEELERLRKEYSEVFHKAEILKKPGKLYERNSFIEELQEEMKKIEIGEVIVDDVTVKAELQKNSELPVQLYNGKENIFAAYHLEQEVEKALKKIVWLENGAYLIFDEAEALTIIDVNTGKFSGKTDLRDTVMKTNEWAAKEVARQIRLRDIGGMILIDFIDMKDDKERKHILHIFQGELKKDERRTNLIGFTPLGILQLTRKKTKPAISEVLTVKCPTCEGMGRIASAGTMAFKLERELFEYRNSDYEAVLIELTADVQAIFAGEQNIFKHNFEKLIGLKIIFVMVNAHKPFYEIRQFGKEAELMNK
ncbi:Rne/Rng family ribonuclease [Bacillus sp. Bva_UNVM-123]|uniref:Rne/Rng family ribonuclease n=1 Tax=Bacillus sp. Bva_UNVM-123 TaxID=2829798 RepID=UPI00391F1709